MSDAESLLAHESAEVTIRTYAKQSLDHFITIAIQGRHRGASGGEKAARKLALLMLDEGVRLDDSALAGFIEFIRLAKHAPSTCRDVVKGW